MKTIWEILSIEPTTDQSIIKKAYRKALPNHHPESDPEGFKALREAYESALNYQESSEEDCSESSANENEETQTPEAIQKLYQLMDDPQRRFLISAWETWIHEEINDLSLDDYDNIQFWVLQALLNQQYYLANDCARIIIQRFNWEEYYEQHSDEHSRNVVLSFIHGCQNEDLIDHQLLVDYPLAIQNKILEFYQNCNEQSRSSALHHLSHYLYLHHNIPMPNDPRLIIKIAHWYMLIDEPKAIWLAALQSIRETIKDDILLKDVDYLINFHRMVDRDHYIQLLTDLNPHCHLSVAFQAYLENANLFPFIHMAHFFKYHVLNHLQNHQLLRFEPVIQVSLPLSFVSQSVLRDDVTAMIEDYWGNCSFDFLSCGLNAQPTDPIQSLLYAVWVIKYGDEWSLDAFIKTDYEYDDPIANLLLETFQSSATQLLAYFQTSLAIRHTKNTLKLYDEPEPEQSVDHSLKDIHLIYSWMNRMHPWASDNFMRLYLRNHDKSNPSLLMREYFTYLFTLSESQLNYIQAAQKTIHTWRQQNILLFLFTRTKQIYHFDHHRKLIKSLPKTRVKWFDHAFKMLKKITNNKACFKTDFFWEELIESDLKKDLRYANIFYIYHYNWQYIADQFSKSKAYEFFYLFMMSNITDHSEKVMNDADILLAIALLNSKDLTENRKTSLKNYLARFKNQSENVAETLEYYQNIIETGDVPEECQSWVPPFVELLQLQHKIHSQQPFSKDELKKLKYMAEMSEYNTALRMAALVLHNEKPLTMFGKIIQPFKQFYKLLMRSYTAKMIFIAVCIIIAKLMKYLFVGP